MTTVPFTFTQYNAGDHSTFEDLERVCDPFETDVVSLNEMYNRRMRKMLDRLLDVHPELGVVDFPDVEGARANPFIYVHRTMELRDPQCYKVLKAATRAGKHNMQKNLVGGVFRFKPVPCRMNLFGKHSIQTQQEDVRRMAAMRQSANEVERVEDRDATTMIGGDWNIGTEGSSLQVYYRHNWAYTQAQDPTDTFEKRNIDGVMWHGPRDVPGVQVRFLENTVVRGTKSDHMPIRASYSVKVKPW